MQLYYPIKNIGHKFIRVTQWFGETKFDYSEFGMKGHNGIDIGAPKGTPIYAAHDGWIIEAWTKNTGYGIRVTQYFEEEGFGWEMHYGHMDRHNYPDISYNIHDRRYFAKAGEVIGYVDSTGVSSGHHLHFGLRRYKNGVLQNINNGYRGGIDPKPYLTLMLPEEELIDMIERKRVNGTEYLEFNKAFSIGIASPEFAKLLTDADIPIEDSASVATEKFTLTGDAFTIHKK